MDAYTARVLTKHHETPDVIFVEATKPSGFSFTPGQFVSATITDNGTTRHKPYSVYSHPSADHVRLCIKLIPEGFASEHFKALEEGDELRFKGPLGQFTLDEKAEKHVFLATGVGIAPLHSLIVEAKRRGDDAALYHGVRRSDDLIEDDVFNSFGDWFSYHPVLSRDPEASRTGYVQDHAPITNAAYYLCGVQGFVEDTTTYLKDMGVSEALINTERFT